MKASPVSEVEKPKAFIHWVADPVEVEVSFAILHTRQDRYCSSLIDSWASLQIGISGRIEGFDHRILKFT